MDAVLEIGVALAGLALFIFACIVLDDYWHGGDF